MIGARLERARLQQQAAGAAEELCAVPAAAAKPAVVSGSKVVRDSTWREKLLAGGKAGLGSERDGLTADAGGLAAACGREASGGVVGLGSFLPKLPVVVKA